MADLYQLEETECPICDFKKTKEIFVGNDKLIKRKGKFRVVQCNSCGLIYTNPRPTEDTISYFYPANYDPYQEDSIVEEYTEIFNTKADCLSKVKNDVKYLFLKKEYNYNFEYTINYSKLATIYALIKKILFPLFKRRYYRIPEWIANGKAIDFGCGGGAYLVLMTKLGWNTIGIDMNELAGKYLSSYNIPVLVGDLDNLNIEKESIDFVSMWHSLEHTHQPLNVLKIVFDILKKGGKLYLELPNSDCFARYLFGQYWFPWELPRHLYHFSPKSLKSFLSKVGFTDIHVSYLSKETILKSLDYLFEFDLIKRNAFTSTILSNLLRLSIPILSIARRSDVVFVTAKKPL